MSVWFEGESSIECSLHTIKLALEDPGEFFVGVVSLMPGLSSVELVEQEEAEVTIRTNEGLMRRTNISTRIEADRMVVEFDETYDAGSKVTTTSHFVHEYTQSDAGVAHHLVMSDVEAPGFLGFFYQRFGSNKTGNAFLTAHKTYLERQG